MNSVTEKPSTGRNGYRLDRDAIERLLAAASRDGVSVNHRGSDLYVNVRDPGRAYWQDVLNAFEKEIIAYRQGDALSSEIALTVPARHLLCDFLDRLEKKKGDRLYEAGDVFRGFECGPNKLCVIGAPPAIGKTALAMQFAFEATAADSGLRTVICNAEMSFDALLTREISRRAGICSSDLRFAKLNDAQFMAAQAACYSIAPVLERIEVMQPPFTSARLYELTEAEPGLLIVDYLQKFATGSDVRVAVNELMAQLRYIAMAGWGVLALSSTSRTAKKGASSHDSSTTNLASFKESGEIEFNADSVYLLRKHRSIDMAGDPLVEMELDCAKNRFGEQESIQLVFDVSRLSFERRGNAEPASKGFGGFEDDDSDEIPFP